MDGADIVYLTLLDMFDGVSFGKTIRVDYVYNQKRADVRDADWVFVYEIFSNVNWLGINTNTYDIVSRVAIDVRTADKQRYAMLKKHILDWFRSAKYEFNGDDEPVELREFDDFVEFKHDGAYVVSVRYLGSDELARGDYVKLVFDDGTFITGWVWGIYNGRLVIFQRRGIFWMVMIDSINELSDKMKGLYRFVINVRVRMFIGVCCK